MWWQILEISFSGRANVGEEWLKGAKAWGCFRCVRPRYLLSPLTKPTHKGKISISRFSSNRPFHEKVFLCNMRRLPVWCQSPTRLFLVLSEQQGVTQPGGIIKFKIKMHSVFFFFRNWQNQSQLNEIAQITPSTLWPVQWRGGDHLFTFQSASGNSPIQAFPDNFSG